MKRHSRRAGFLIGILFLTLALSSSASPIKPGDEQAAVKGWLARERHPLGSSLGGEIAKVDTFNADDGKPAYYAVYLKPAGFVIVPADDEVEPIIAFSPGEKFDPSSANPLGALVSNDVVRRVAQVRNLSAAGPVVPAGIEALSDAAAKAKRKWAALMEAGDTNAPLTEAGLQTISDVRCAPLLQSKWDQSTVGTGQGVACFNYYTPPNADGSVNNYVCGCVATAMAQFMRYHQFPTAGIGVHSFSIKVDGVSQTASTRGGNGSGGAYDWSAMVLVPSGASALAQRQAIGALTHDAGVSVSMSYTEDGSGTDTLLARDALTSVFGYAQARSGYDSGSDLGAALTKMVNPNLDAAYPVLFGITGAEGGHAIVCDGYGYDDSTLYHHLNLGWSGSEDAWYALPHIDAGSFLYTSVYKCVYNIFPSGTGEVISGRVTDSSGAPLSGVSVTATHAGGGTYTDTTDAKGIFAFAKVPSSAAYTVTATKTGYTFSSQAVSTGQSQDKTVTCGNVWGVSIVAQGGLTAPVLADFSINNGAPNTASRAVSLYSSCTSGAPTEYLASESSSFSGAVWLPYANPATFQLSDADGAKKVYFMVRNSAGSSAVLNATIVLSGASSVSLAQALDAPALTWSSAGSSAWLGQTAVTHDGSAAAKSGPITDKQSSWLETTVAGPGTLSFWWRVSSEADYDFLSFAIDGTTRTSISGATSWTQLSYSIPSGSHTLRWTYSKDGSISLEDDAGYLDQVAYSGQSASPEFFSFSPLATNQKPGTPFQATITARDAEGHVVSGYAGTVSLSAASRSECLLFREGFENGFGTWTIESGTYNRATVSDTCANGLQSFTMSGGSSESYNGVSHTFPSLRPDRVGVSVRAARSDAVGGYFVFGADKYRTNSISLFYMQDDGNMVIVLPDLTYWTVPYVAGRWYRVEFLLNWAAKTYDWVVDGTVAAQNVPFCNSEVEGINIVSLYNFDNTQAWWDEIEFAQGGSGSRNMLGDPAVGGSSSGSSYTDGFTFTPNKDIQVTHVRHYYGSKVSIWRDTGELVVSVPVTSQSGQWKETPLGVPVSLSAGVKYRLGIYYPAGTEHFWMAGRPTAFSDGLIQDGCYAAGDAFPATLTSASAALFMVDLRYGAGAVTAVPVSPAASGSFVNGVWTGNITLQQAAANVVLTASDGAGHSGASIPVNVGNVQPTLTNDNFSDRTILTGVAVTTTAWNTNATKEPGEPNHADSAGGKSVWFSWSAPAAGTLTLSTAGSTFDTLLGLYTGSSVSDLKEVASNDDANPDVRTSLIVTSVVAGVEYQIAVDGYGGASGTIVLNLSLVTAASRPSLSTTRAGSQLVLSWSTNWTGFVLESSKSLGTGALWEQVSPAPIVVGTNYSVTNALGRPMLFYRLRR